MEYLIFPAKAVLCPYEFALTEEEVYHAQIRRATEMVLEKNARFVFLAGPSCSGKTTTSLCLLKELEGRGKKVMTFSTDDFFFDQDTAPKNADGTPNYDAFEHTDSMLLVKCIRTLAEGRTASLPLFDFVSGKRRLDAVSVSGKGYDIFIIEGIHALNDSILSLLPDSLPSLSLYLDVTSGVKTEDESSGLTPEEIRFCRRLIRDFKHRNATAERTFALWKNVLLSEREILHPFRKNASFTISTNFSYEISVEKSEVESLLSQVGENSAFLKNAQALKEKLSFFPCLSEDVVPEKSVLREFID